MSDYRRYRVPGATVYITIVTYNRRPILTTVEARRLLRNAIDGVRKARPFHFTATVLLPDHWHMVIELPRGDADYSTRIKRIKEDFTKNWLASGYPEAPVTRSQRERGERGVWRPRSWEHTVRGEQDLQHCVDYIHYNPVKHGLVRRVCDWSWSSFHRFAQLGHYEREWGGTAPPCLRAKRDWGEP